MICCVTGEQTLRTRERAVPAVEVGTSAYSRKGLHELGARARP